MATSMTKKNTSMQTLYYTGFNFKNKILFKLLRNTIVDFTMPLMTTSLKWITQVWATHRYKMLYRWDHSTSIREAVKKIFLVSRPLSPFPLELSGHRNVVFFWTKRSLNKVFFFLVAIKMFFFAASLPS